MSCEHAFPSGGGFRLSSAFTTHAPLTQALNVHGSPSSHAASDAHGTTHFFAWHAPFSFPKKHGYPSPRYE
jgi:hypothetical protein